VNVTSDEAGQRQGTRASTMSTIERGVLIVGGIIAPAAASGMSRDGT
jgi:hypothetical protein